MMKNRSFPISETRKDSAVHVSLSSSSLVKQPRTEGPNLPERKGSDTLTDEDDTNRLVSAVVSLNKVRSVKSVHASRGIKAKESARQTGNAQKRIDAYSSDFKRKMKSFHFANFLVSA
jgi:hypothetical protein